MAGYMSCRAMPLPATFDHETMLPNGRAIPRAR
jgi:hypothetical protein